MTKINNKQTEKQMKLTDLKIMVLMIIANAGVSFLLKPLIVIVVYLASLIISVLLCFVNIILWILTMGAFDVSLSGAFLDIINASVDYPVFWWLLYVAASTFFFLQMYIQDKERANAKNNKHKC